MERASARKPRIPPPADRALLRRRRDLRAALLAAGHTSTDLGRAESGGVGLCAGHLEFHDGTRDRRHPVVAGRRSSGARADDVDRDDGRDRHRPAGAIRAELRVASHGAVSRGSHDRRRTGDGDRISQRGNRSAARRPRRGNLRCGHHDRGAARPARGGPAGGTDDLARGSLRGCGPVHGGRGLVRGAGAGAARIRAAGRSHARHRRGDRPAARCEPARSAPASRVRPGFSAHGWLRRPLQLPRVPAGSSTVRPATDAHQSRLRRLSRRNMVVRAGGRSGGAVRPVLHPARGDRRHDRRRAAHPRL